jgi:hypothetical protein
MKAVALVPGPLYDFFTQSFTQLKSTTVPNSFMKSLAKKNRCIYATKIKYSAKYF